MIGVIIYSILGAWSMFYLYNSFSSSLAWTSCQNWWNTDYCITTEGSNSTSGNVTIGVDGVTVGYNVSSARLEDGGGGGRVYELWGSSNTTRTSLEEYFLYVDLLAKLIYLFIYYKFVGVFI